MLHKGKSVLTEYVTLPKLAHLDAGKEALVHLELQILPVAPEEHLAGIVEAQGKCVLINHVKQLVQLLVVPLEDTVSPLAIAE